MAEAITIICQVLNLIATPTFANEVLWMARAMQGEQGTCFPEEQRRDIAVAIGQTILNRVRTPRFPNTVEWVVREGFFGYINAVNPKVYYYNLARAILVIDGMERSSSPRYMFMFSKQDCEENGFDMARADLAIQNGDWGLYFYEEYPGETQ